MRRRLALAAFLPAVVLAVSGCGSDELYVANGMEGMRPVSRPSEKRAVASMLVYFAALRSGDRRKVCAMSRGAAVQSLGCEHNGPSNATRRRFRPGADFLRGARVVPHRVPRAVTLSLPAALGGALEVTVDRRGRIVSLDGPLAYQ